MNIEFVSRNYDLTDNIREFAAVRVEKIERFLDEPIEVRITLEQKKHLNIADLHVAHRFGVLQANESTDDMYDSMNLVISKVEKQARRSRKKHLDKRRRADRTNGQQWPVEVLERASIGEAQPRIVKSSALRIKPMTIDEAALQLEDSKNDFVVFRNASTERVNVLYKRRDNNFGLITPES